MAEPFLRYLCSSCTFPTLLRNECGGKTERITQAYMIPAR